MSMHFTSSRRHFYALCVNPTQYPVNQEAPNEDSGHHFGHDKNKRHIRLKITHKSTAPQVKNKVIFCFLAEKTLLYSIQLTKI